MPTFDAEQGCHIVRIVYDGPGFAGKTTNLQQVCALLPATKRSELYTPAELKGRTMFFDWMEVKGPPITSVEVKFHLITVPGQIERNYRRRPLVEMADVVVFVCDCMPESLPDSMRTFARLRGSIKRRGTPVPVIVQANKQDAPGAMEPHKVRKKLRLSDEVPIIAAEAHKGEGVRETLARAMRIGLQALAAEPGMAPAELTNADALFDHVLTFEDTPDEQQMDVEELYIHAEEVDAEDATLQMHLSARSLDDLEAKAKRAAAKAPGPDAAVPASPTTDTGEPAVARRKRRKARSRER
ncbi:MAG: ADP-ribosylation factor-like protein [Polyangiaceae bacterium]